MGHAAGLLKELPAMLPMCRKTAEKLAKSCGSSATGPDSRLKIKVSRATCHICATRGDLIEQLKKVYIDGELETTDTTNWFPKDHSDGLHRWTHARERARPDRFSTVYGCGGELNYKVLQARGGQTDRSAIDGGRPGKRKQLVWAIDGNWRRTARDRSSFTTPRDLLESHVKGLTLMVKQPLKGWRMEDLWLDK